MPALKLCPVWAFPGSCELAPDGFHQGGCAVQTLLLSASSLMWGLSLLPANYEAMGAEWNTPNISYKTGHGPIPATATGCQHKSLLCGTLPRSQHPVPGLSGDLVLLPALQVIQMTCLVTLVLKMSIIHKPRKRERNSL